MESLSSLKTQSWLTWFLRGFMLLGFLALMARTVDLQIIRGDYFRTLSEGNRIRRITIQAPRGEILSRGGEVLAGNKEIKKALIYKQESGYEKTTDIEGFGEDELIVETVRDYKLGSSLGHVTGYVGEVNEDELGKINGECPEKGPRILGSYIGRTGLEEKYECLLAGIEGEELVEVDARGTKVRVFGRRPPLAGQNLITTVDYGLQKKLSQLMEGKKGAIIATDKDGEVLALYSSPPYDPNIFVNSKNSEVSRVLDDKNKPLFNRVIGGMFHPGSVYKPFVAIAALEDGKIDEDFKYEDTGQIVIDSIYGTFSYKNWYFTQYGGKEGNIDLKRALARSTDTFFYKIGELTGAESIFSWSEKFGFNKKTGIDLPGEIEGLVPNPEWKIKNRSERWFLGNTYHLSIGQGDLAVTPLQINTATLALANDGKFCRPHLAKNADNVNDLNCNKVDLNTKNVELVKAGMKEACSPGGTAYTFFDFKEKSGVEVACKTGTAQNVNEDPHAWFSVFGPVNQSNKSFMNLTVMVESGGEGSKVAGPIAREIFDYWFKILPSATLSPSPSITTLEN